MKKNNLLFKIVTTTIISIDILAILFTIVSFVLAGIRIMVINNVNFVISISVVCINLVYIAYLILSLIINKHRLKKKNYKKAL